MRIRCTPNTNSASVTSCQSYESILTPSLSPWILDLPSSSHNSDQKHRMIRFASTIIENSRTVMRPICCINWYWNGSLHDIVFQTFALKDWSNRINFKTSFFFLTFLCYCFVRVFCFSGDSMIFDVFKCSLCPSTIASCISVQIRTINELLFRQWYVFVVKQCPWLSWCNCAECPARPTLTLIFNWRDCSFCGPVDFNVGTLIRFIDGLRWF